jgi:hypothetical protein
MAKKPATKEYELKGTDGYTITLSKVPEGITPRLIDIPPEEHDRFMGLTRDGNVKLITSIAGNLVFEKVNEDGQTEQVNSFTSPVRLTYNFTPADEEKRKKREHKLHSSGQLAETENVRLVPIFLYQLDPEKTGKAEFEVWLPFQNFKYDQGQQRVTIEFLFWGDQPIGGGTRP